MPCPNCNSEKANFLRDYRITKAGQEEAAFECLGCGFCYWEKESPPQKTYFGFSGDNKELIKEYLSTTIFAAQHARDLMEAGSKERRMMKLVIKWIYMIKEGDE